MAIKELSLQEEIKINLSKPWRLPKNLFYAAICTFAGISIGILIHTFHRGLPYIAADLFIWTLATYNVSQLGVDAEKTLKHSKEKGSLRKLFLIKNLSLLILAFPIDLTLIIIACALLNDWSKFWLAITLAITAVIIGLGLGNVASVVWVYKPGSLWAIRKDRLRIFEYIIFIAISYVSATAALLLATLPAWLLLKVIGIHKISGIVIGLIILLVWSCGWWYMSANVADKIANCYRTYFIKRLNGKVLDIKNHRLKKVLKIQSS